RKDAAGFHRLGAGRREGPAAHRPVAVWRYWARRGPALSLHGAFRARELPDPVLLARREGRQAAPDARDGEADHCKLDDEVVEDGGGCGGRTLHQPPQPPPTS